MGAVGVILLLVSLGVAATAQQRATPDPSKDPVYVCPMDPDVRSHSPGAGPRGGVKLAAGIPAPVAFHLALSIVPQPPKAGQPATMTFAVHDPWKDRPV